MAFRKAIGGEKDEDLDTEVPEEGEEALDS